MEKGRRHDRRADEMARALDGDLHLHGVPVLKCGASTVASAISRFSVGDQAVVVARPTCRPPLMTGTADREAAAGATGGSSYRSYSASTSVQSTSRPTISAVDRGPALRPMAPCR